MVHNRRFLISDDAYSNLRRQAQNLGYINPTGISFRGLGSYATALSCCTDWDDRRDWKDSDLDSLESGYFPFWFELDTVTTIWKTLTIPKGAICRLAQIARDHGIVRSNNKFLTPNILCSNTLEAVGLDLLVPMDIEPSNKHRQRRVAYYDSHGVR